MKMFVFPSNPSTSLEGICMHTKVLFCRYGPLPDPTQAYFWPAVNKRLTALDPGTFRPNPKRFFLIRREQPDPSHKKLTRAFTTILKHCKNLFFNLENFSSIFTVCSPNRWITYYVWVGEQILGKQTLGEMAVNESTIRQTDIVGKTTLGESS